MLTKHVSWGPVAQQSLHEYVRMVGTFNPQMPVILSAN